MKHFYDEEAYPEDSIWDNEYFVNIKLDYSAFIVEYTNKKALKFYARNLKPITKFSVQNRHAILAPAIDIVKANKAQMFSEPGYYHFEYKNPEMVYGIDNREPGLYFSYYRDYDNITRKVSIQSEVKVDIPIIDLVNSNDPKELLTKYNLLSEEGLVIHFYNTDRVYKIVLPRFEGLAKLKRSIQKFTKTERQAVKDFFEENKNETVLNVKELFKQGYLKEYKFIIELLTSAVIEKTFKLDMDFLKVNPALFSYKKILYFYNKEYYIELLSNEIFNTVEKDLGTAHYELVAFVYITITNLIEKELNSPQIEL